MERLEIDLLEIFFKMFRKNDKFLILVVGFVIIKFGKGILLVRNFGNLIWFWFFYLFLCLIFLNFLCGVNWNFIIFCLYFFLRYLLDYFVNVG